MQKKIEVAWDVWQQALAQLHNMHEQERRVAGYEMEVSVAHSRAHFAKHRFSSRATVVFAWFQR